MVDKPIAPDAGKIGEGVRALIRPTGVALVGVSDDPGKMSGNPIRVLAASQFEGPVYPVNPKRDTIGGHRAYASVDDIEGNPDVALIVVPRDAVATAIAACGRKGVKAAIVISSGFAETGELGAQRQAELKAVAKAAGVRVVGPNCTGYFSAAGKLPLGTSAAFLTGRYRAGNIAFITQSGAIGTAMLTRADERGMGPSLWFSTGNEMDLQVSDLMLAAVEDEHSRALILYLESIRDVRSFGAASRVALEAGKPIIALKVGRSSLGAEKAQAHTGALIGSDGVYDGFFRQNGIIRVDNIDSLLPVAAIFQSRRDWGGGKVGVVSVSGGLAVYSADLFEELGIPLAVLAPETLGKLGATSEFSTPGNPFDPAGAVTSNPQIMIDSVQAFLEDPDVDVLVVVLPFGVHILRVVPPVVAEAAKRSGKMICLVRWMPADYGREQTDALRALDIPVFESLDECAAAIKARTVWEADRKAILSSPAVGSSGELSVFPSSVPLLETETRALLAAYGLRSPREAVARGGGDALKAATAIGFPVVMKILSPDIAHKTEAGGVVLGVSESDVSATWDSIVANAAAYNSAAHIEGVLVQETAPEGVEVIVGAKHDSAFGPVVMVGMGGVLAEALASVSIRPIPLSRFDAESMIDEAGLSPLLASARRGRPSDRGALVDALLAVSRLMNDHGDHIAELDVNPLRVLLEGEGVIALDGLIVSPAVEASN
ncbi:acetate--CoA ligase family protein [Sphingobium sp. Sx8-8]|uniref:acetate--CoA ligase family protein n=1 Tax=Sphingobium sp. Sx8-8 TaxID=2933617 RepID=UPI001F5A7012|nr:acetate--CoA ligase family protein [Sphingobium sp. Sx8-8]